MAAPPGKPHTRATSIIYFKHAFSLFGQAAEPIILGLQNKFSTLGTVSMMDVIGLPPDEFSQLEYANDAGNYQGLTRGEVRLAKSIQLWAMFEFDRDNRVDFEQLTMMDYDAF